MPTNSKTKKKQPEKTSWVRRTYASYRQRLAGYLNRRPHRTFRLSRRRDYIRPLELPGNFAFTHEVTKTLWTYKKIFSLLTVIYIVLYGVLVGVQSQDTYTALNDTLSSSGSELFSGDWGIFEQAGGALITIAASGFTAEISEAQQIFSVLVFLLVWLSTVWLLRNLLAGHKVRLRDGLYSSGAPLFAMTIIVLIIIVQLIPVALAMLAYGAAANTGILAGGAASMMFWIAAALLALMSLYWITSSLFAMVIVTLPGMYPLRAIKSAGDLMQGRRTRILLRWIWMALALFALWFIVLVPFILLDMGIKALSPALIWLPIIPVIILLLSAVSVVWGSAYVYLLYRKVVDYVPES